MRKYSRIYLDTNIFIALKETGGDLGLKLVELLAAAPTGTQPFLTTSELTLAELLTKPHTEGRDDLIDQYDNWMLPSPWLDVGPVERSTLWFAAILRSNYRSLKLPDAIHISTAIGFECSHLLTNDNGMKGDYQIIHKRYGPASASSTLTVVRPTIETIDDILSDIRANQ
jgi:predicted nucleic acid-binding protein